MMIGSCVSRIDGRKVVWKELKVITEVRRTLLPVIFGAEILEAGLSGVS